MFSEKRSLLFTPLKVVAFFIAALTDLISLLIFLFAASLLKLSLQLYAFFFKGPLNLLKGIKKMTKGQLNILDYFITDMKAVSAYKDKSLTLSGIQENERDDSFLLLKKILLTIFGVIIAVIVLPHKVIEKVLEKLMPKKLLEAIRSVCSEVGQLIFARLFHLSMLFIYLGISLLCHTIGTLLVLPEYFWETGKGCFFQPQNQFRKMFMVRAVISILLQLPKFLLTAMGGAFIYLLLAVIRDIGQCPIRIFNLLMNPHLHSRFVKKFSKHEPSFIEESLKNEPFFMEGVSEEAKRVIKAIKAIRVEIQENSIPETLISVPWRCSTNHSDAFFGNQSEEELFQQVENPFGCANQCQLD